MRACVALQDVYEDGQLYSVPEAQQSPPGYSSSTSRDASGTNGGRSGSQRQQGGDDQSWGRRVDYDEVEDW